MPVCDYGAVTKLLPPLIKALSGAKGIRTLVSLPKIDEIHAGLNGSCMYYTFDVVTIIWFCQKKERLNLFATPLSKFQFTQCPFGLDKLLSTSNS